MASAERALIIGGGMGGLAAAIALQQAGIDAVIFERMPALQEVGSGLTLWANGMGALDRLGAGDAARAAGSRIERIENRTWSGKVLREMPIGRIAGKVGRENVGINRQDLQRVLAAACDPSVLHLGAAFVEYVQDDSGVTARFADGREERGALLIGADGINSAVRTQLLGSSKPRYAGFTCWRSWVRFTHDRLPPDTLTQAYGDGAMFGIIPVSRTSLTWYGTKNAAQGGADPPGKVKAAVLDQFRGLDSSLLAVVEATDEAAINRIDICDRDSVERWGDGRVTLIGDAVHPPTPFLGQGACMAIEDAVVLSRCLGSVPGVTAALRAYENQRRARTAWIQGFARGLGGWYHGSSRLAQIGRDVSMKLMPAALLDRQMEKIINYEP
jgi:2-polyprenyl-6-methoxyphenol hydroxylase-like FAD-dependent oxidoreductase